VSAENDLRDALAGMFLASGIMLGRDEAPDAIRSCAYDLADQTIRLLSNWTAEEPE
jgi:hypothetical protein